MKTLIFLLFPFLAFSIDLNYRKIECEAYLLQVKQDKTIFYLRPGQSISSRLSLMMGKDEIFLTINHNMVTDSEIAVKDYHYGTSSSPEVKVRVSKKFKMKDLENSPIQIQIPTKNTNKTATIECRLLK